ncbi:hypothetical protein EIP86_000734 [Pleurotus ostreatoroseus]|nr:hypothetical protein EIP86_000734 [Pleurotus ostreatoroseus]
MSFFGSGTSGTPPADTEARKKALMDSVKGEIALANAQELMNKANEKCFQKCVTKPGTSLSRSEEACLSSCLDRYMEAFNIVSRTYLNRLRQERQAPDQL